MKLIDLLGAQSLATEPKYQKTSSQQVDGYLVERYQLALNGIESVPAICVKPLTEGPHPVVLFQHSHGGDFGVGKTELLESSAYLASPSFAKTLTDMGYAVWAIDAWGFEERGGIAESELVKEFLLTGRTLWGMRLFDVIALIDYLETREDMDMTNLATIGMSMGGLLSWWLAAIDPRVQVCIDIAAQVDLETLLAHRRLDHHGFYYYVPNLLTYFSTAQIQAMIAPRARMSLVGKQDTMCINEGVEKLNNYLQTVYIEKGARQAFVSKSLTGGHMETSEMRYEWCQFLKEHTQ
ncbi:hydrolase [Enterococcus sp. JM4C]|uniref:dienelactone hydrolase family protein n=1 Tax=Candidatus Enterococcus huntleyi TaxID=1857217 RepID=UPI00137A2856|nr:prolyl oligopeptidase family serine peptidase [Enterococcus sp. JM4C]KAF1299167.1 hydrolase [Enterococcus sp. JM4C]